MSPPSIGGGSGATARCRCSTTTRCAASASTSWENCSRSSSYCSSGVMSRATTTWVLVSRSTSLAVLTEQDSRRCVPSGRVMSTSPGSRGHARPAGQVDRHVGRAASVQLAQHRDVAERLGRGEAGDLLAAGVPGQDRAVVGEREDAVRSGADDLVELAAFLDHALEQPTAGDRMGCLTGERLEHGEVGLGVALEPGAVEHSQRAETSVFVDQRGADGVAPTHRAQQVGDDVRVVCVEARGLVLVGEQRRQRHAVRGLDRGRSWPLPSYSWMSRSPGSR